MTYYWVFMFGYISGTKIRNNIEETPFDILGPSTDPKNHLRVKLIVEGDIGFLLKIDYYYCD